MQEILWLALATSGYCVWVRRATWFSHWDRTGTNAVILMTVQVLMMTPAINLRLSPHLYALFGVWNLEQWFGHVCFIGSLMGFVAMGAFRLKMTDAGRQRFLNRNISLVGAFYVSLSLALFVWAGGGGSNIGDIVLAQLDPKMFPYWCLLLAAVSYLVYILTMVMWELRKNPASRCTANLYLIGCAVIVFNVTFDSLALLTPVGAKPVWVGIRVVLFIFAFASARSWNRRVRSMRGQPKILRGAPTPPGSTTSTSP